ncbi:MAG TPA: hypothetical protein VLG27_05095 [Candidatus Saccharimonadia bacterium]|nr:hypothetical protein [Candidatus Saccharimonadia bacterium]
MSGIAKAFLYLIYGVIVAGLIIAIASSLHHDNKSQTASKPSTSQSQPKGSEGKAPAMPGASTKPSNSSSSSSKPNQPTGSGNAQLGNTGPGDTVGLFVLASVAGSLIYRWRLVHRLD